jgi:thiol-disulfide isomerase/thioredoxin
MHRRIFEQIALAGALLLAGCSRPSSAITFEPVTYTQWTERLAGLKGQIVVADLWATWCSPCIERFPHMVEMSRRYKDRGVTFVSLSLDNREDRKAVEAARAFVAKQNATFRNYVLDENILQGFEKLDIVAVPAVLVYDRSGRRRYKLTGDDPNKQFTEKDVEAAVTGLLKE